MTCRAIPWSRLILETKRVPDDLNLKRGQRVSVALVALATGLLPLGALRPELLGLSAAALLTVVGLNRDLFAFFLRERGLRFATACIPLHLLYFLYSGLSYLWVWSDIHFRGSTARPGALPRGNT